jgi:hypothetical protein
MMPRNTIGFRRAKLRGGSHGVFAPERAKALSVVRLRKLLQYNELRLPSNDVPARAKRASPRGAAAQLRAPSCRATQRESMRAPARSSRQFGASGVASPSIWTTKKS